MQIMELLQDYKIKGGLLKTYPEEPPFFEEPTYLGYRNAMGPE